MTSCLLGGSFEKMSVKGKHFQHKIAVEMYQKPKLEKTALGWRTAFDSVKKMVNDIGSKKDSRKGRK